jgi:hypothetical protein
MNRNTSPTTSAVSRKESVATKSGDEAVKAQPAVLTVPAAAP